jgi:outer membrane protein assembly factor BamB
MPRSSRRGFLESGVIASLSLTSPVPDVRAQSQDGGAQRWQFQTGGDGIYSSPTIVDGTVYVAGGDRHLYAIDAADGTEQWNFETDSLSLYSPMVVGNTVYIPDEGTARALNANDGTEQWSFDREGIWYGSSPIVVDDTLYIGGSDGTVYALNTADGTVRWSLETDASLRNPVVANGRIYIGGRNRESDDFDGVLYGIDIPSQSKEWTFETEESIYRPPTYANGTLYFGTPGDSSQDRLYALDAVDGTQQWSFEIVEGVSMSPTVDSGSVYFGTGFSNVYALDPNGGTEQWMLDLDYSIRSSPTIADNTLFFGSDDGYLYAVDAENGTQQWRSELRTGTYRSEVVSSPTVVDGVVYVGSIDGYVYALDAGDGVSGSSTGSRVTLAMLGHHNAWANNQTPATGTPDTSEPSQDTAAPSILSGSVRLSQTAVSVESKTSPVVEVTVANVDENTSVHVVPETEWYDEELEMESVNTRQHPMQPTAGEAGESGEAISQHYRATVPVPDDIGPGTWVSVAIRVEGQDGAVATVSEYDTEAYHLTTDDLSYPPAEDFVAIGQTIGFGTFDQLVEGPMVVGMAQEQTLEPEQLQRHERALEHEINRALVSSQMTMGGVGVNLRFDDNGGAGYQLQKAFSSDYESADAIKTALKQQSGRTETAQSDAFLGMTHTGGWVDSVGSFNWETEEVLVSNFDILNKKGPLVREAYRGKSASPTTFIEELLHAYGYTDLYPISSRTSNQGKEARLKFGERFRDNPNVFVGNFADAAGQLDLFGDSGYTILSTGTRIAETLNLAVGGPDPVATVDDAFADLLDPVSVPVGTDTSWQSKIVSIPKLYEYQLGEEVTLLTNGENRERGTSLILEWRDTVHDANEDDMTGPDGGIVLYRARPTSGTIRNFGDPGPKYNVVLDPDDPEGTTPLVVTKGGTETVSPALGFEYELEVSFDGVTDGEATVQIDKSNTAQKIVARVENGAEEFADGAEATVGRLRSMLPRGGDRETRTERQSATEATTLPTPSLRAIDADGRVIGYTGGEYRQEIPGSRGSGDQYGGLEWIEIPPEIDAEFEVIYPSLDATLSEIDTADLPSVDLQSYCQLSKTAYLPDSTLVTNEQTVVDGASTTVREGAVEPGETRSNDDLTAAVGTDDAVSDDAQSASSEPWFDQLPVAGVGAAVAVAAGAAYLLKRRVDES